MRMDDVLGSGWRLFTASREALPPGDIDLPEFRATDLAALNEIDGVVAAWFERHGCAAALVRPDHYVFGTVREAGSGARAAGRGRCRTSLTPPFKETSMHRRH
jgi:3-(3-hydroxy-phenyl)propionate hydroxylase